MQEVISYLTSTFTLAFVVSSMFGLGLGLTVQQILQPLRNVRLVLLALVANFVILPLVAFAITRLLPLEPDLQIGLLLLASVAGAPATLKAAQIARGNLTFAVSLVTLQVVTTIIYVPLVLPLLVPGVQINTVALALPLFMEILVPLILGLLMNARYDEEAQMTRPIMLEISNISLALLIVVNLVNVRQVFSLLGTGAIAAALAVIVAGIAAGYFLAGPEPKTRRTLALGTGQRNYAAAFVIAAGNFAERPAVFLMLLAASLLSMIIILLLAGEFRRRNKARGEVEVPAVPGGPTVRGGERSES